jgi:hypothetical protein
VKYYIVQFRDGNEVKVRESIGVQIQDCLLKDDKWIAINGNVYNSNLISSIFHSEMEAKALDILIPIK